MVLKVRLIGSGVQGDAYRVALPTYTLIHGSVAQGFAYVSVPDDVYGLSRDDLKHEKAEETTEGLYYPELCKDCTAKMSDYLDNRYQEHKGEYKVDIVGAKGAA